MQFGWVVLSISFIFSGAQFLFEVVVGSDDVSYQSVAHHVALVKLHDFNAFDVFQYLGGLQQTALLVAREVDLGQVACHHEFGVAAHSSEEHFELRRCCVLGLVEDDEGVVQGAAAHECQRGYLDGAVLPVGEQFLLRNHVAQGVVERLQVGVELVAQVAGQESKVFASLDGGASQHNAAHLLVFQGTDDQGHGGVGLARSGRSHGEDHVVAVHCIDQSTLVAGHSLDQQAVAAVDEDFVAHLGFGSRATAFDNLHDGALGQAPELFVVGHHGLQLALEMGYVVVGSDGF